MADKITQLQKELGTIIKGKKEVTDKIIMAVLARGHVLLEEQVASVLDDAGRKNLMGVLADMKDSMDSSV